MLSPLSIAATGSSVRVMSKRAVAAQITRDFKVLCALYPDPKTGCPPEYARSAIPPITKYSSGQTTPTPHGIDFKPGELLGCVSGALD